MHSLIGIVKRKQVSAKRLRYLILNLDISVYKPHFHASTCSQHRGVNFLLFTTLLVFKKVWTSPKWNLICKGFKHFPINFSFCLLKETYFTKSYSQILSRKAKIQIQFLKRKEKLCGLICFKILFKSIKKKSFSKSDNSIIFAKTCIFLYYAK